MRKNKLFLILSRCLLILLAFDRLLWPSLLNVVNDPEEASNFETVSGEITEVRATAPHIVIKRDDGQYMAFEFPQSLRGSRVPSYVIDPTELTKWQGRKVTVQYVPVHLDYYKRNRAYVVTSASDTVTKATVMENYRLSQRTDRSVDFLADIVGIGFLVFFIPSLARALRKQAV